MPWEVLEMVLNHFIFLCYHLVFFSLIYILKYLLVDINAKNTKVPVICFYESIQNRIVNFKYFRNKIFAVDVIYISISVCIFKSNSCENLSVMVTVINIFRYRSILQFLHFSFVVYRQIFSITIK